MNGPPDASLYVCVCAACLCECHLGVNVCVWERRREDGECGAPLERPCWGVEAWGSPEGTARLEEPLAGQQLNKRWEGSVSLEGQERWDGPTPQR